MNRDSQQNSQAKEPTDHSLSIRYVHLLEESETLSCTKEYRTHCQTAKGRLRHLA